MTLREFISTLPEDAMDLPMYVIDHGGNYCPVIYPHVSTAEEHWSTKEVEPFDLNIGDKYIAVENNN